MLDLFVEEIYKSKMLNEIQKLMFDRAHFARFLVANEFDIKQGLAHFSEYLQWRKQQKIDALLVKILFQFALKEMEFVQYDKIKEFFPNGFHETDK